MFKPLTFPKRLFILIFFFLSAGCQARAIQESQEQDLVEGKITYQNLVVGFLTFQKIVVYTLQQAQVQIAQ